MPVQNPAPGPHGDYLRHPCRQDDRHRWQERLWQVHHEQLYFTGPCNKLLKVYNRQSLSGPRRGHFESYSIYLDDFLSKVNCCCASMIHKVERFLVRCWRDSRRVRKYWKFWSVFQWVHLPSPMIWYWTTVQFQEALLRRCIFYHHHKEYLNMQRGAGQRCFLVVLLAWMWKQYFTRTCIILCFR